jgi:hypothetical protein
MAFSNSSYFAGIGTVVAAISLGFAGGAMITTNAVQPPNRLERVISTATPPSAPSNVTPASTASSNQASQQASVTTPAVQSPAVAKIDAVTNVQQPTNAQAPPPPQAARNEDSASAKNERANLRSAEPNREASRSADINREASRKRGDERKFSEHKRRQDLERQNLDEATNVVRQMPRGGAVDRVVEEDDAPRFSDSAPRRLGLFGSDEDSPRASPPPRFGLFGN